MKVWAGVPSRRNAPIIPPLRPGGQKGRQHSAGHVKVVAIGPSTGGGAGPEGERIGGVGQNGRHADEQKRREGYETASAGDRVLGPTQSASDKKEDGLIEPQG